MDALIQDAAVVDASPTPEVDARPSDAIALAVRLGTPIYVSHEVFEEATLESKQAWPERHRREFGGDAPDPTRES